MAKFIEIKFKKPTIFLGRNGPQTMTGAEISSTRTGAVYLIPLNTRGVSAASRLEIPKEDIPKLIDALLAVTAEKAKETICPYCNAPHKITDDNLQFCEECTTEFEIFPSFDNPTAEQ